MSIHVNLATAVVARIEAAAFAVNLSPQRVYDPYVPIAEMGSSVYTLVAPVGRHPPENPEDLAAIGRAKQVRYYDVDVAVTQRTAALGQIDALTETLEQITALFDRQELAIDSAQARCTAVTEMLCDRDKLDDGQVLSLARLTFQVIL